MGGLYKYSSKKKTAKPKPLFGVIVATTKPKKKDTKKEEPSKEQITAQHNKTYNDLHKQCETIENEVKLKETKHHAIQQLPLTDGGGKSKAVGGEMGGGRGDSTPNNIHLAAMKGNFSEVRWMLHIGYQVDALDQNGYTPLMYASQENQLETAILLITYGSNVNHQSRHGFNSLMFASWQGHAEMIALLIKNKANVKAKTFSSNDTALHFAALAGYPKACLLLRKAGAQSSVKNKKKKTPMDNSKAHANQMQASMTGRKYKGNEFERSNKFNAMSQVQEEYMKFMMA